MGLIEHIDDLFESSGGLAAQMELKMADLFRDFSWKKLMEVGNWIDSSFTIRSSATPRGQKELKADAEFLLGVMIGMGIELDHHGNPLGVSGDYLGYLKSETESRYGRIRDRLDDLERHFSRLKSDVPDQIKIGKNVYINEVGFKLKVLQKHAKSLEAIWSSLKGWRKSALKGGLTVIFARSESFKGTAGGKYRRASDEMLVRATTKTLKYADDTYGSLPYVLVHELAHRYESKVGVDRDFGEGWYTTRYSINDGETFAELFALGHFGSGLKRAVSAEKADKVWATVEKFEEYMKR